MAAAVTTPEQITAVETATEKLIVELKKYLGDEQVDHSTIENLEMRQESENAYRQAVTFLGYLNAHTAIAASKK